MFDLLLMFVLFCSLLMLPVGAVKLLAAFNPKYKNVFKF